MERKLRFDLLYRVWVRIMVV